MKVCTDSCILGAWVANKISENNLKINRVLDIGTGTGLLSLMLAQKINTNIDALEIDENAFKQAKENFQHSPWAQRLRVLQQDATTFISENKYDLIISNPPFFENDLRSTIENKNLAKHDVGLTYHNLIRVIKNNISSEGNFAVLLPYSRIEYFKALAIQNGFYLASELLIKQTLLHKYFRRVLFFSQSQNQHVSEELIIKNNEFYTPEFVSLVKDYYLNL